MNEITRIHIAKTAYDIEVSAKKELQQYVGALEQYADEPSILEDIEIRITELLSERGVARDCVITSSDVAAVREQLGEPQDFAEDSETAALPEPGETKTRRRLYRDTDRAVISGVLAGVATYTGINPLWTRLIFIVLLLGSFGTMAIVYLVLWLALPPARTAAEKLELEGKPVTLAAIKQRSETLKETFEVSAAAKTAQQTLLFFLGLAFSVVAALSLIVTVWLGFGLLTGFGTSENSPFSEEILSSDWQVVVAHTLFIVSGLLFTALNGVLAAAAFGRRWTKRIGVSIVAIVVGGIVAFSGGVSMVMFHQVMQQNMVQEMRKTSHVNLPANFADVKQLQVVADSDTYTDARVEYIVSDQARYELDALPGVKPTVMLSDDSKTATLQLHMPEDTKLRSWSYLSTPVLRVYGPALDDLRVASTGSSLLYSNEAKQSALAIAVDGDAQVSVSGTYETVAVTSNADGSVDLEEAAIGGLSLNMQQGVVTAGVVRTLTVTQPDVCSASDAQSDENTVNVQAVSSGELTFNGTLQPAQTIEHNCGAVHIGPEDEYESWEG